VADERAHDAQPLGLDDGLDGVGDVAEPVADLALLHRGEQRPLRDLEQLARDGRDRADGKGDGAVGDPAPVDHADVDGDDVPARERVGPGIPCTTIEFGEAQMEPVKPR
jgi:hypothetical protein